MNFFGHATMAQMECADPRFVLGAMLPDFCGMAELRLPPLPAGEVARGVAHHHAIDRAFHRAPVFVALCGSALERLESRAVARAPARAVGHVGSELLLDGFLSFDATAQAAYSAALDVAIEERVEQLMAPHDGAQAARVHELLRRLRLAPVPHAYRDPTLVCDRLFAILAPRPRLALRPIDREPVLDWLHEAQTRLAVEKDALIEPLAPDAARANGTRDP